MTGFRKMRIEDLLYVAWAWVLIGFFFGGIVAAFMTGDFRWLALSVVPGVIFAKW